MGLETSGSVSPLGKSGSAPPPESMSPAVRLVKGGRPCCKPPSVESTDEAEQGVDLSHPSPGELGLEQSARELADGRAVASGFASEEVDIAKGIGSLVLGKVAAIDGTLPRGFPGVGLNKHGFVIEANGGAVGPGGEFLTDEVSGKRVEGFGHLGEVIATDFRVAPEGDVVGLGGSGEKDGSFFGLEVLEG